MNAPEQTEPNIETLAERIKSKVKPKVEIHRCLNCGVPCMTIYTQCYKCYLKSRELPKGCLL